MSIKYKTTARRNLLKPSSHFRMISNHTYHPDKALIFVDPPFLFVNQLTIGTFDFAQYISKPQSNQNTQFFADVTKQGILSKYF